MARDQGRQAASTGRRSLIFVGPHPSFRAEQADFFFPLPSCEAVGLRRETSAPSCAFCRMKSLFSSGTAVGINLSPKVVDYFKALADETGLP